MVSKGVLKKLPATAAPSVESQITIEVEGDTRVITANGIPNHKTGIFPNRGNPNRISPQRHVYRVPAEAGGRRTHNALNGEFAVAINGCLLTPEQQNFLPVHLTGNMSLFPVPSHSESMSHTQRAADWEVPLPWSTDRTARFGQSKSVAALSFDRLGGRRISGLCRVRFLPTRTMRLHPLNLAVEFSTQVWPASGRYRTKRHVRWHIVQDYEYVEGSGDLDECNGRFSVTPEYPDGVYAYFLTEDWPVIPRSFRGTPSTDFKHGPPQAA